MVTADTRYLRLLRRAILNHLDPPEWPLLAADLSLEWQHLPGQDDGTKVWALILFQARQGTLEQLALLLRERDPQIRLPAIPPAPEQKAHESQTRLWSNGSNNELAEFLAVIDRFVALHDHQALGQEAQVSCANYLKSALAHLSPSAAHPALQHLVATELAQALDLNGLVLRPGANLSGLDLSCCRLARASLKQSTARWLTLKDAVLNGADLYAIDWSGAVLQRAQLRWVKLQRANLREADLRKAVLLGAELHGARLMDAQLESADLRGAQLKEAELAGCDLTFADLRQADLRGTNLRRAKLAGADLRDTKLEQAQLQHATFTGRTRWPPGFDASRSGALGPGVHLPQADLRGLVLTGADLRNAVLTEADIRAAHFGGVMFVGADLSRISGANSSFFGANLTAAKLEGADLRQANLRSANLTAADLSRANLRGADLRNVRFGSSCTTDERRKCADLWRADLRDADLRLTHLGGVRLNGACYNTRTRWPRHFRPDEADLTFVP